MEEEIKNAVLWGNSAGVLLPRHWAGKQVKVILIDRTLKIKREVLNILEDSLEDIIGIYLTGSYARAEHTEKSDIDIIAISNKIKKEILSDKYHISIYPLKSIKETLKINPIMIYPRLIEAKTILNNSLLEELNSLKIEKNMFKHFLEETKRIVKINKEFIDLDRLHNKEIYAPQIIYSIILRLRGIFIIKCLTEKKVYSNKNFEKWIVKFIPHKEYKKIYGIYNEVKHNKKTKSKIEIKYLDAIIKIIEKEVKNYE